MRQTIGLPLPLVVPLTTGLGRLSSVPAGRWPVPAFSPQSLSRCLDPYPAVSLGCVCSFLPRGPRPHLTVHRCGTPRRSPPCHFHGGRISGLQSFRDVQAPILARPPGCTYRGASLPPSRRVLSITRWTCGYPSCTVISLRARTEPLTRLDFHQLDCGLAGRYRTAAFRPLKTVG